MNMEKVSVIIPTYNRAHTLEKSVRSVLDQTFGDFELIIVDDASSDNTETVVKSISDERVNYHRLTENKGAAGARNEGVKLAKSSFIAFHDSDDVWLPDKLKKQADYIDQHPEYDLVYGKVRVLSDEGSYEFPNEAVEGDLEGDLYPWLLRRNTIDTPTMFIRKAAFEEVGGFDSSLRCIEDWEFALRFSMKHKIGYIDEVLIDSYISEGGVSRNKAAYYETRCKLIQFHRDNIEKLGIFDEIVMDMFSRAERSGVLPQVQQMLVSYLSGGR